jgi:hypothetical protein
MYFFGASTWMWGMLISVNFYLSLVHNSVAGDLADRERRFNAIAWGVPLAFLIVAALWGHIDTERAPGSWYCFVATGSDSKASQIVLFYSWFVLVGGVAFFVWPVCLVSLYRAHLEHVGSRWKAFKVVLFGRYMLFMMLFCAYFVALLVFRLLQWARDYSYSSLVGHSVVFASIGVWISLVFAATRSNAALWARLLRRSWRRLCGGGTDTNTNEDGAGTAAGGGDSAAAVDEMFDEIYGVSAYLEHQETVQGGSALNGSARSSFDYGRSGGVVHSGMAAGYSPPTDAMPTSLVVSSQDPSRPWLASNGSSGGGGSGAGSLAGSMPRSSSALSASQRNTKTYLHGYSGTADAAGGKQTKQGKQRKQGNQQTNQGERGRHAAGGGGGDGDDGSDAV